MLKIDDVSGTRWLQTTFAGRVKIPEENAAAALEIMSRFAVDPRWLIYLPPTMSPASVSQQEGSNCCIVQRVLGGISTFDIAHW